MNFKKNFNEVYKAYLKSAIVKSLVCATLISCSVLFITSFVFWMIGFKLYWIALIVFGLCEALSFGLIFAALKPTDKKISKKLDELGLEQRVVTMQQFKDDDS
ncbi:MAG: hypothetical protein HUK24_04265, partial [Sphaerochaetaceae bacterium]|nr:hypothetical protein [Sphaerochaetaceae bacterium]